MGELKKLPESLPLPVTLIDLWGKLSDESAQMLHAVIEQLRDEWEPEFIQFND